MKPTVSHAQRRALHMAARLKTVAVSSHTNEDLGYVDARVADRLIGLGHLEQIGFNSHNQAVLRITGSGIEVLDAGR